MRYYKVTLQRAFDFIPPLICLAQFLFKEDVRIKK